MQDSKTVRDELRHQVENKIERERDNCGQNDIQISELQHDIIFLVIPLSNMFKICFIKVH